MVAGAVVCDLTNPLARRCANFDGVNDYIDCGNDASLNFGTGDFTIATWIYSNGYSNQGSSFNAIMSKGSFSGTPTGYYGFFLSADDTVRFSVIDDGYHVIGSNIRKGWHHLVGCRSGNNIYFYIDGEYQGTDTVSGSTTEATDFYLGRDGAANRYFNGSIGQTLLYNKALTTQEIENLSNGLNVTDGLVSKWKLSEDYKDSIGNNDGTNSGSYLSAVDEEVATAISDARTTANDKYLMCVVNNKLMTSVIEEAP